MPAVWEPNPAGAAQDYSSSSGGEFFSGVGAPSGIGSDGDYYLDTGSGTFYKNTGGTWTSITTFGLGGNEVVTGTGSPEGVVTAAVKTFYVDPTNHQIWVKEIGAGNTGWALVSTYA